MHGFELGVHGFKSTGCLVSKVLWYRVLVHSFPLLHPQHPAYSSLASNLHLSFNFKSVTIHLLSLLLNHGHHDYEYDSDCDCLTVAVND